MNQRTTHTPNEIINKGDVSEIILYNKDSQDIARTIIDTDDLLKVVDYKWTINAGGYVISMSTGRGVYLHRLVAETPQNKKTDHINNNRLDNRKINLRNVTDTQNSQNMRSVRGSSKYKGVCYFKKHDCKLVKPWLSYITIDKKRKYLGYYATEEEAAHVYDKAAKELFGEFAKPNFTVTTVLFEQLDKENL